VIATRRLYWALGGLAVFGLLAGVLGTALPIWLGACAVLGVALAAETWQLLAAPAPHLEREAPESVAVGVWTEIEVRVTTEDDRSRQVEVFDKPPSHCQLRSLPQSATVPADRAVAFRYEMKATERGAHSFEPADLRWTGPLGLLRRQFESGPSEDFRVLPNFKAVARYVLLAVADKVGEIGIRHVRRRGTGMEFSHLREYRQGDRSRQIDWKASARHQKLISREYEDEKNQQLVFLLDCGRRMRARDEQLSHFDRALNASLLLTHVALDQGDSVAASTFGGADRWVPQQKGPNGMNVMLNRLYDLEPTTEPSDFTAAARRLSQRQRRRSLVVLLTNLYDQLTDELLEAIALLRQRHVVMVASLREESAEGLVEHDIDRFDDALLTASAHHYLERRKQTHRQLESRGVILLDVSPRDLSVQLVNRYIEVKREGLL